jgi:predicted membrane protein
MTTNTAYLKTIQCKLYISINSLTTVLMSCRSDPCSSSDFHNTFTICRQMLLLWTICVGIALEIHYRRLFWVIIAKAIFLGLVLVQRLELLHQYRIE